MTRSDNLKVGERFKVIKEFSTFTIGSTIELVEDDGSDSPFFSPVEGRGNFKEGLEGLSCAAIYLGCIERVGSGKNNLLTKIVAYFKAVFTG